MRTKERMMKSMNFLFKHKRIVQAVATVFMVLAIYWITMISMYKAPYYEMVILGPVRFTKITISVMYGLIITVALIIFIYKHKKTDSFVNKYLRFFIIISIFYLAVLHIISSGDVSNVDERQIASRLGRKVVNNIDVTIDIDTVLEAELTGFTGKLENATFCWIAVPDENLDGMYIYRTNVKEIEKGRYKISAENYYEIDMISHADYYIAAICDDENVMLRYTFSINDDSFTGRSFARGDRYEYYDHINKPICYTIIIICMLALAWSMVGKKDGEGEET